MPNSDQRVGGEIPLPGASEVSAGTNQVVDLILRARLKALAHNLGPILQPSTWEGKFPQLRVPHKLWKALDQDIGVPTEKLRKEILEIVEDPAEISWQKYHDLVARSEPIFGESLEVQRGLAVRDKLLDENICEIADHLIIDCAEVAFQSPSLTVPASHEALARTMGRILRIRYPEWTVWTLPLIALEYGHVIVREAYVREPIEEAFSAPVDPGIVACLYSLVAEAFATYTMGPSYAYAMILLRLDARRAFTNEVTHAAPDTRVNLILFMLEKMNEVAQEKYYRKPYVDSISKIEQTWAAMVTSADPVGEPAIGRDELRVLGQKIWEVIYNTFRVACYPTASDTEGWSNAESWSRQWMDNLRDNQDLSTDTRAREGTLRDILNAAWLCRIADPNHTDDVAKAARAVCLAIVNPSSKTSSGRRGKEQSSSPPKRSPR